jgi:transposase
MERVPTRLFTIDFKIEAVKLITAQNLSYTEAGRRLDIPPESIRLWHQQFLGGTLSGDPGNDELSPEQQHIEQLERELAMAKSERDTLKNAVAHYFTGQSVDADGKRILTGMGVDIVEYQRLQRGTEALIATQSDLDENRYRRHPHTGYSGQPGGGQ